MAVCVRRGVHALPPDDETLAWYGRAVRELQRAPRDQPGSWAFLGACHGIDPSVPTPPTARGLWRQCQHSTWFFLPWHRGYLAGFEAIVAETVARLGGPEDWALPYWNYGDPTDQPRARELPPAFRNQRLADGSLNPLWAPRAGPTPPQAVLTLSPADVALGAMGERDFTGSPGSVRPGFGGPRTGPNHLGGPGGALEAVPHNVIHRAIGAGGGLMADVDLAALDPIFWLHHANIDRLWEHWRAATDPPRDPADAAWLSGTPFALIGAGGARFTFLCRDALDTEALLHGYRYDDIAPVKPAALVAGRPPPAPRMAAGVRLAGLEGGGMEPGQPPDLIAASEGPVRLGAARVETEMRAEPRSLRLETTRAAEMMGALRARRLYLRLEGVVGRGAVRDYRVFIDLPEDDRLPLLVGTLAPFGIEGASDPDGPHGGGGLTQTFDITEGMAELGLGATDLGRIRVSFDPIRRAPVEEPPKDYPYALPARREPGELTVGRVNLYAE